ncbi:MAG: hypothetical protein GY744_03335 [Gammaproteobacteria bacterium]|nr:hypothetical protein [Gammaproteobacteria bacterium]
MDATALRWVLGIIGVVFIAGIYLYSLYQSKQRRQAAIKTFTHEEIESGFIEDEALRNELSNINAMLDEDINAKEINKIKINPGLESEPSVNFSHKTEIELPRLVCDLLPDHRIAHVLKPAGDRLLTAEELRNAFTHTGFQLNDESRYKLEENPIAQFQIFNLTAEGSFQQIDETQFTSQGLVCCINLSECAKPLDCYEIMLKKIDELVRILELKVYSQELDLLTLQHVTDIRKKLVGEIPTDQQGEPDSGE